MISTLALTKHRINSSYILALTIIAILSTVAFYALISTLRESDHTAYIVNISGKQRMLSQHIALDVARIHQELEHDKNVTKILTLKKRIDQLTLKMKEVNHALSTGELKDGVQLKLSEDVYTIYFDKDQLAKRVFDYIHKAREVLNSSTLDDIHTISSYIHENSESLLVDLNKVVYQYQREGNENLDSIQTLETSIWLITLIFLFLEALFIFKPLVKEITKLTKTNEDTMQNLENLVSIRTKKLEEANKKLETLASHDPLTGLYNRLYFENEIEQSLQNYQKNSAPFALLMFDIDFFKKINDNYGHDSGDVVLIEIAKIFKSYVRNGDRIYRTGGEEFVILLNRTSLEVTLKIAEQIRVRVEKQTFTSNDYTMTLSVSCGVWHSENSKVSSVNQILKKVDQALYDAKAAGKNRIMRAT